MMEMIRSFLSIDTIAVAFPGYPMSWLELVGTVFYLASVYLIARKSMWTWPTGIVSVILYFFLFYQIRLYADALEQIYYLVACVYGWWFWNRKTPQDHGGGATVRFSPPRTMAIWAAGTLVLTLMGTSALARAHLFLPSLFPEPASWPLIDTLTTLMSFSAMFLMARKRTESWVYWIIVDVLGIWLYAVKEVLILSVLYVILLGLAIHGLLTWLEHEQALDNAS